MSVVSKKIDILSSVLMIDNDENIILFADIKNVGACIVGCAVEFIQYDEQTMFPHNLVVKLTKELYTCSRPNIIILSIDDHSVVVYSENDKIAVGDIGSFDDLSQYDGEIILSN